MLRRLAPALVAFVAALTMFGSPAGAHNSLAGSSPADGASLDRLPSEITLTFAKEVPLDTMTVTVTDPSARRTSITDFRHGASKKIVVVPVSLSLSGLHSLRWRLVSADGHAISGRVEFTLAASAVTTTTRATTTVPTTTVPATAPASTSVATSIGSSAATATTDAVVDTTAPATEVDETASPDSSATSAGSGEWTTPGWIGWVLRYGSYVAIMLLAGAMITDAAVWRKTLAVPQIRSLVSWSLIVIVIGALAQLLVLSADIGSTPPWRALDGMAIAADTGPGMALVARIALAIGVWALALRGRPGDQQMYSEVSGLLAIGMLATWAAVGHSRTMRWSWLGLPADVVHHGAAAAWLGGLVVMTGFAVRLLKPSSAATVMRRFSRVATTAVAALVVTGVVQTVRLMGGIGGLFGTGHGRLVIAKVVLLAPMLWLAYQNRQRMAQRLSATDVGEQLLGVRRFMAVEIGIGAVILGLTASLVVGAPGVAG